MSDRQKPPDQGRLRQLGAEIQNLKASDLWTEAEFRRFLPLWREACGDKPWMIEALLVEADESWLDGIVTVN